MKSLAAESPAWSVQEPAMSEGMSRLLPLRESDGRVNYVNTEKCRTLSGRVRQFGEALVGKIGGVDSVHTLGLGLGRTGAGLARIPYVLAGVQYLQGLEPGSSPTSGTRFHCSGACGPLNVYKSPCMGPCGGPFLLVAGAVWRVLHLA
jgi:hypothetical protein